MKAGEIHGGEAGWGWTGMGFQVQEALTKLMQFSVQPSSLVQVGTGKSLETQLKFACVRRSADSDGDTCGETDDENEMRGSELF